MSEELRACSTETENREGLNHPSLTMRVLANPGTTDIRAVVSPAGGGGVRACSLREYQCFLY